MLRARLLLCAFAVHQEQGTSQKAANQQVAAAVSTAGSAAAPRFVDEVDWANLYALAVRQSTHTAQWAQSAGSVSRALARTGSLKASDSKAFSRESLFR